MESPTATEAKFGKFFTSHEKFPFKVKDNGKWEFEQWSPEKEPFWSTWNEKQRANALQILKVMDLQNQGRADSEEHDNQFHPDFVYANPSRPDLTDYKTWKQSPINLSKVFYPYLSAIRAMMPRGDNEFWFFGSAFGRHSGGPYMGVPPSGKEFYCDWHTIWNFKDGKVIRAYSICDVLSQILVPLGILNPATMPINPYR